jgi:tetratricopeptide (TPR) repeat protein
MCKVFTGAIEEALPLLEQAIRLSPRDAYSALWYNWIGRVHLLQLRTDEAGPWFERARRANPALLYVHSYLASLYGLKGETERAASELSEVRRLSTDGRYSSIARLRAAEYFGVPKVRALFETTISLACVRPACRKNEPPDGEAPRCRTCYFARQDRSGRGPSVVISAPPVTELCSYLCPSASVTAQPVGRPDTRYIDAYHSFLAITGVCIIYLPGARAVGLLAR